MALLGSTVDPRLFVQDYSGFTRAAEIQAQGMSNLGGQIAGGIEKYGEMKKQSSALSGQIKGVETQIDSAINLFPEMADQLGALKLSISDPSKSLTERAAEASSYGDFITNSLNMMKTKSAMELAREREARMGASAGAGGAGADPSANAPIVW